jgi:hypothetical protein
MRKLPACLAAAIFVVSLAAHAAPLPKHVEDKPLDIPIPKGAVHIVATTGDAVLKKEFDYFPYPYLSPTVRIVAPNANGTYRVEVDPAGKVAAITILKTLGKRLDYLVLKTFIRWKGKPGPFRVIDINWYYRPAAYNVGGVVH